MEIDDVERQEGAGFQGDHRGVARRAREQRQLADKLAGAEDHVLRGQLHFDFAVDDEIHAVAGGAAAHDHRAGREIARPQQFGDLGDQRGADIVEERHLGDQLPGAQELAPPQLMGIPIGDDAGPQGKEKNAADHQDAAQNPAADRLRHDVAISGRCHRHDPPPQRGGDRGEGIRVGVAFEQIGDAGCGQENDRKAEQHRQERLAGVADHPAERRQARRIADIFEGPDKAEQTDLRPLLYRHDSGQRADQVEQPAERHRPEQPGSQRPAMLADRRRRRGNQAQDVFGDEKGRHDIKTRAQDKAVVGLDRCFRLGEHDRDPDGDHRVMHRPEDPRLRIPVVRIEDAVQEPQVHRASF